MTETIMTTETADGLSLTVEKDVELVECRLADALAKREKTQALIQEQQKELDQLFAKGPSRPRETADQLVQKITQLERERTIRSIPLSKEREILRQIQKFERMKRQAEEFQAYDQQIKTRKTFITELRDALKVLGNYISKLRIQLSTLRTAESLGCSIEDLLGMKLECPPEKLGEIIGKKGGNIKSLMSRANVMVDIARDSGDVRLVGALGSLDIATLDLGKVIATEEILVDAPPALVNYLTSKHITTLAKIRECHPDVQVQVTRGKPEFRMKGLPEDMESLKNDLSSIAIVEKTLRVNSQESSFIVGKQGTTIDKLITMHQAAIQIDRGDTDVVIMILGPNTNVDATMYDVEGILAEQKEVSESIYVDKVIKQVLLMNKGAGMARIYNQVNEATKAMASGTVSIRFEDDTISIKTKAVLLPTAVLVIEENIRKIESNIVRVPVDPVAIPNIIGKGGKGVKEFHKAHQDVTIEFDKENGECSLGGLEKVHVKAAHEYLNALLDQNQIKRIFVDPTDYKHNIAGLLRSKIKTSIDKLVFLITEDKLCEIILRGSSQNIATATQIITQYLIDNHTEEVEISGEDMRTLLAGGRNSKITSLQKEFNVHNITIDRDRHIVLVRGDKDKVSDVINALHRFLYGGEGMAVTRINVDEQFIGSVIGRGGKNRKELERKYENISITIPGDGSPIILRGPEAQVEACRADIVTMILNAKTTETVSISEKGRQVLKKTKLIPCILADTTTLMITDNDKGVTIKGNREEVRYAVSLLTLQETGVYETMIELEPSKFRVLQDSFREPSHLTRMEKESRAKIELDLKGCTIHLKGDHDQVKKAKELLYTFFEFLFSAGFARLEVHRSTIPTVATASAMTEVYLDSGAVIKVDRDVNSILVYSSDPLNVQKAVAILDPKLKAADNLVSVLQLNPAEDWLVSSIIGQKGKHISSLRKETRCRIEVDSQENRITLSANDAEIVASGRKVLDDVVSKAREQCIVFEVPDEDIQAFVGKAGSHINKFQEENNVEVQSIRKMKSNFRITGEKESVAKAKKALDEWLAKRRDMREQSESSETLKLKRGQIHIILGNKGSVVRKIQAEFGCHIDINRVEASVTVRSSSQEKCTAAIGKIRDVIVKAEENNAEDDVKGVVAPSTKSREKSISPLPSPSSPEFEEARAPYLGHSSDFPSLPLKPREGSPETTDDGSNPNDEKDSNFGSPDRVSAVNGSTWASVVHTHSPKELEGSAPTRKGFAAMVSECDWDATSLGDDGPELLHEVNDDLCKALELLSKY